MLYKFEYILNDKDYLEFNKYQIDNSPTNKKTIVVLRLFLPALFIVSLLLSFTSYENSAELFSTIILYVIISVVWFFFVKPFLILILRITIKLMKKDGKLPYGKNILIQFDEDFFFESTNVTEMKIKYSSIEKTAIGNSAIYIYIGAIQAFIIPLSVFETEEQKNAFLAFVNSKSVTTGKL